METKWCDTNGAPNYVAFDMGRSKTVTGWKVVNAGAEASDYITRTCLLQVRDSDNGEWKTVDMFDGNTKNEVERSFEPVNARFVRLFITGPSQDLGHDAARVYEFEVY